MQTRGFQKKKNEPNTLYTGQVVAISVQFIICHSMYIFMFSAAGANQCIPNETSVLNLKHTACTMQ